MGVPVILDCDPGHDDAVAIVVAARHAELLGITTVAGNAPLERTTHNALAVRELLGVDVPVHSGAARPLVAELHTAPAVHGVSGLDGAELPTPTRPLDGTDAVGFIVDTCRAVEGVWIVGVGPLTNVALALRVAPDLAARIAGISIMGGGTFGNRSPVAEFNIWADPEAAAAVFGYGGPLVMAGLDLTHQLLATPERIAPFAASPGSSPPPWPICSRSSARPTSAATTASPAPPCTTRAPCWRSPTPTCSCASHATWPSRPPAALTRGMTVIDRRTLKERPAPNCDVLTAIDADAAFSVIVDAIASFG